MRRLHRLLGLVALAMLACALGCKGAEAPAPPALDLDADPIALLPGSVVAVANLDARAMFASASLGAQLAALADAFVPFGEDAGFQPKRDVDRVVLGMTTSSGADVAAVLSGRFDPAKIAAAKAGRGGAPITHATYAGQATSAVGDVLVAVLTAHTAVAGTGDGVRRVLERVQDAKAKAGAKLERAIPAWMLEPLATPGASVAAVADFTTQPVAAAAFGSIRLPWLEGLHVAKVVGNFEKPGMNVAATLTYGDASQASSAADGVRTADRWLRVLGPLLGGISLKDLDVKTDGDDLKCTFAVDDATLAHLLGLASQLLPASR